MDALYRKEWVVYAKPPLGGPEQVLKYLARYTPRAAITHARLVSLQDDRVVLTHKDYTRGQTIRTLRLLAEEFIRRFLLHVLPDRFVRSRYYRLLAHRPQRARIEHARRCSGAVGTVRLDPTRTEKPGRACCVA